MSLNILGKYYLLFCMLCVYYLTLLGRAGLAGMGGFSFFVAVIVVSKSLSGELRKKKSHLNSLSTLKVKCITYTFTPIGMSLAKDR